MTTMQAVVLEIPGPSEVLWYRQVPRSEPSAGQVLIWALAFRANRSELFTRQCNLPGVRRPRMLGIEAVSTVEAALGGKLRPGQRAATVMGGMGRAYDDSYAEYTYVPAGQGVTLDTTPDLAQLGTLPELLQIAWRSLKMVLDVQAGQTL
jgi:NADPH:quinone reductase